MSISCITEVVSPFHHDVARIARDGLALALHRWIPHQPTAAVVYVHGIQSHGGWMFETGPHLASRGVAVHVLDRRGSGASEGPPGNSEHDAWIADYVSALEAVRCVHPGVPLTLIGQSFGGSLAAAVGATAPHAYDAIALVAPALNQIRGGRVAPPGAPSPPLPDLVDHTLVPIPLEDRQYTRDPRYLAFMRDDPRMLRAIGRNHRRAQLALTATYMSASDSFRDKPAALFLPRVDEIIDLSLAREAFGFLAPHGVIIELPSEDHYLEFSPARTTFLELLLAFVRAPDAYTHAR